MKIHKIIVKTTLSALIALGAVAESANAAQPIHASYEGMNAQQAKRAASQLRHMTDNFAGGPLPALHPLLADPDATGTRELLKAAALGNIDQYIIAAKTAIKTDVVDYINAVLLPAGNNPFIVGAVDRQDNGGGPNTPADVNRDSFTAALSRAIDAPDAAALELLDGARARVAAPASLRFKALADTEEGVKNAIGLAAQAWINTLLNPNGAFLDGAVAVGHGGEPADDQRDSFTAALIDLIDGVEF